MFGNLSVTLPRGSTYIGVAEAHGTGLALAQEEELVVGVNVRDAAVLLVAAAHLAGVVRLCKKPTGSIISPKNPKLGRCPRAGHVPAQLSHGEGRNRQSTQFWAPQCQTEADAPFGLLGDTAGPSSAS